MKRLRESDARVSTFPVVVKPLHAFAREWESPERPPNSNNLVWLFFDDVGNPEEGLGWIGFGRCWRNEWTDDFGRPCKPTLWARIPEVELPYELPWREPEEDKTEEK